MPMPPAHLLAIVLFAGLSTFSAHAQQAVASQEAPASAEAAIATITISAPPRGALFKVTAHGHTMHLFGTLDVKNREAHPVEPRLMDAIRQAKLMYLEVVEVPFLRGAWSMLSLREDPAYKGLSDDLRRRLDALLKRHGVGAGYHLTPVALSAYLVARACPYDQEKVASVEEHLAALARKRGIPVESLDDDPMATIKMVSTGMPQHLKLDIIATTVATLESATPCEGADERSAWLNADQTGLDTAVRKVETNDTPSSRYLHELLQKRNAVLADKLITNLREQDRVVLAIHHARLLMADGLVARLQASGATVERIY